MSCPDPKLKKTTEPPTPRQLDVLRLVEQHRRQKGFAPTARELCELMGLGRNSTQAVFEHLTGLERRGLLEREPHQARTARATPEGLRWLGVTSSEQAKEGNGHG